MKNKYYYWISSAVRSSLILVIACIFYGAFMFLGSGNSLSEIVDDTIMFYFVMMSTAFASVFTFTTIPYMTDIALSFGSTRKDIFKGANIFNGTIIILLTAILIILCFISNRNITEIGRGIITYIFSLVVAVGIGSFGGVWGMKKGVKLGLIYSITILSSIMLPLLLLYLSGTFRIMTNNGFPINFGSKELIVTAATIVLGLITYTLGAFKMKEQFYKHEVRI